MVAASPGEVGCWKPGRVYGAGGALQAGDSPFTDADFEAYNAISGNELVDHFNSFDASTWAEQGSHGDWGTAGGELLHDGADSGNGNDPNAPHIIANDPATGDHTEPHLSMHYECQIIRRGDPEDNTDYIQMICTYPAAVSILADYDNDEFDWVFESTSHETGSGGNTETTAQKMHVHIRRRDDDTGGEFLAGIWIDDALTVISDPFDENLAATDGNYGIEFRIGRDSNAGNAEETGNVMYAKVESKER